MAVVTSQVGLQSAITARDPEIIIANNITLTTYITISYAVTIKGQTPNLSLFWGNPTISNPDMLVVSSAGTLTLESIILDAQNRDGTLVYVIGGTLIMNDETIIRNVQSSTAQSGVKIGTYSSPLVSGTFIMNGGLITGINSSDSVFCTSGSVIMNNNASISENSACGVAIVTPTGGTVRASLTMTGNSHVTNNHSRQSGGGLVNLRADIYMGVNDGDAPEISGNLTPSGSYGGGIFLSDNATLTMRHNAKVWGNNSDTAGGGLIAQDAVITMQDNSSIVNNVCDGTYGGGGARIHQNTSLILEDNAHISDNTSASNGGGIYLQPGAHLEMKGNSYVDGNEGVNGAGIYLGPPSTSTPLPTSALIGADNSFPSIHNNTASGYGGGIFIGRYSTLDLTGNSSVSDNTAENGAGIYKMGILNVSQSPKVLDGLFFDDIPDSGNRTYKTERFADIKIAAELSEDGSHIVFKAAESYDYTESTLLYEPKTKTVSLLQDTKYTDNVPVITDQLKELAEIHLEASEYLSPPNVPLVIADKGVDYEFLCETDRKAWQIPPDFGSEYTVILNEELNQVLIAYEVYNINYCHLYGTDNPNPDSYSAESEFPIMLQNPGVRPGYEFAGWHNCAGELITEISEGTIGDILLIALWEKHEVYSINYCHLYGADNPNPDSYSVDSEFPVILQNPGERTGYEFVGWHDCEERLVTEIPEGTTGDILLIAVWKELGVYSIDYCHLYGVNNPNPASYNAESDLPLILQNPGERTGYEFAGWHDCEGRLVTEIPEGTTGDILLIAIWKEVGIYSIDYCHLYGANNPNPSFYSADSRFPIVLRKPGERLGYVFTGWYDCTGQLVTVIPRGTTGDIQLIALWKEQEIETHYLHFYANAKCVSNVPEPIPAHPGDIVDIPHDEPKKPHYSFMGWNTRPCGNGVNYCPGDKIMIANLCVPLYAQWKPIHCEYAYYEDNSDILI